MRFESIVEAVAYYASSRGEKRCLADTKKSLTYTEYWKQVAGFAAYLKRKGVGKGDCVVVRNSQNTEFATAGLSVQLLGGIFVPVEKNIADSRIEEICRQVSAVCYIAAKPSEIQVPYVPMHEAGSHGDGISEEAFCFPKKEEIAEILFTTGTTGKSKGIVLRHSSVVAVAENVIDGVEMKENNVELIPVPLSHSHGLRRYYSNMLNGSMAVLLDGVVFANRVFSLMDQYHVTSMDLVPAALTALLRIGKEELAMRGDRIDYVQLGSAPIPEQDRTLLKQILPGARLYNFYGTTESGCSCILDFQKEDVKNCIGRPALHARFAFLGEDGAWMDATPDNPGLLACAGEMNMDGYLDCPQLNAETIKDGYIVTQDLSYMGDDGRIYLLGRKGDVIQSGGNKIAPQEIEEVAATIPGICDCACIPVSNAVLGQEPKLFYVTEKNADVSEEAMYAFLKAHLEAYKIPKRMERLDQIPRTYNGKIQRNELIRMEQSKEAGNGETQQ